MTNTKRNKPTTTKQINKTVSKQISKFIPAAQHSVIKTSRPIQKSIKDGILIKHREYVSQISSSVAFTQSVRQLINPGNALLFPWLSTIAPSFERFRIRKLVFEYQHQAGTTTSGIVGGFVEYDPADGPPLALGQLLNNFASKSGAPYDDFKISYYKKEEGLKNYVISPAQGSTGYSALSHPGEIRFFTQNAVTAVVCGLLWVDYEIEMLIPNVNPATPPTDTIVASILRNGISRGSAYDLFLDSQNPVYAADTEIFERGVITFGTDYSNRSRVHFLNNTTNAYSDLMPTDRNNSFCLWFDRPGVYQVGVYEVTAPLIETSLVIDSDEVAYDSSKISKAIVDVNVGSYAVPSTTSHSNHIFTSLLIVVVDAGARLALRHIYNTSNSWRNLSGMGITCNMLADTLVFEAYDRLLDLFVPQTLPLLSEDYKIKRFSILKSKFPIIEKTFDNKSQDPVNPVPYPISNVRQYLSNASTIR